VTLRRSDVRLALATLAAAAAGAVLGNVIAPDDPDARRIEPPPRYGLASGAARLPLPAGWEPLQRRSSLPGLEDATAVRGIHSAVALDIRAPEDASLLPGHFVAMHADDLPKPRLRLLDDHPTWRYELPGARPRTRLVALTLPTTRGVVTIACEAAAGVIQSAAGECEEAMSGLQLDGASVVTPAPETAARLVLPDTVARLNRERRAGRGALAAARSPRARSDAALRLADAYVAAADRLRPLAAGAAQDLTEALVGLAREHRRLAAASRRRGRAAALRAGAAIERGERRLAALLAAVSHPSQGSE